MTSSRGRGLTNVVAVIVIVALLVMVGIPFIVIFFAGGIATTIWLVSDRSRQRDTERLFNFYIAADAILREEERRWYGFEIADTIEKGEELLERMPDSPPLHLFALGALQYKLGNHLVAADYLSKVLEDESCDERQQRSPSPQLRRYVKLLRRIEAEPSIAPQTLGSIRNLERTRLKHGAQMLSDSRSSTGHEQPCFLGNSNGDSNHSIFSNHLPGNVVATPQPISELLHDLYQDQ